MERNGSLQPFLKRHGFQPEELQNDIVCSVVSFWMKKIKLVDLTACYIYIDPYLLPKIMQKKI